MHNNVDVASEEWTKTFHCSFVTDRGGHFKEGSIVVTYNFHNITTRPP